LVKVNITYYFKIWEKYYLPLIECTTAGIEPDAGNSSSVAGGEAKGDKPLLSNQYEMKI
jgi:hypothetical protein